LGVDYVPIVDVRTFKDSKKGKGKEVAEVAKYTIKSSNIMANLSGVSEYNQNIQDNVRRITDSITDEIVHTLDSALKNRRLMGYGGVFKEERKKLKIDDKKDDLIHTGTDEKYSVMEYEIERYRWDIGYKQYMRFEGKGESYEQIENADD
jgi:plasmid rolling circle replication initiator protein Rep